MSCDMMVRVHNAQTDPRHKLALVDLADNTGDGFAWGIELAALATFACCTEEQAREDLKALERFGWLKNVRETSAGYFEGEFARGIQ